MRLCPLVSGFFCLVTFPDGLVIIIYENSDAGVCLFNLYKHHQFAASQVVTVRAEHFLVLSSNSIKSSLVV